MLVGSACTTPLEVVAHLGAVQSQDFPSACWAVGQRTKRLVEADVLRAFESGAIVRTHVLRPTWHFVAPADLRWMAALTGPRVKSMAASYHRRQGIDGRVLARSRDVMVRALEGGRHLTRAEIAAAFGRARLPAEPLPVSFLVMDAELDAIVCSGPRRGKQFTYALVEERVAPARPIDRDEAVAELVRRYFASHGPATTRDFAWWSGLTQRDARAGLEVHRDVFEAVETDGLTYWLSGEDAAPRRAATPVAHLLPNYDEHLGSYRDRAMTAGPPSAAGPRVSLPHALVIDGRGAGGWRRIASKGGSRLDIVPSRRLSRAEADAVAKAAERYREFAGVTVAGAEAPALRVGG